MILQYIQNAGSDGAKAFDAILEYLQGTLPSRNTYEQNETLIYHLLSELRKAGLIEANGRFGWQKINSKRTVSTTVIFVYLAYVGHPTEMIPNPTVFKAFRTFFGRWTLSARKIIANFCNESSQARCGLEMEACDASGQHKKRRFRQVNDYQNQA